MKNLVAVFFCLLVMVFVPAFAGATVSCDITSDGEKISFTPSSNEKMTENDGFIILSGSMMEFMSRPYLYFVKQGGTISLNIADRCMISVYEAFYLPDLCGYLLSDWYNFESNTEKSFKAYIKPLSEIEGAEKILTSEKFLGFLIGPTSISVGREGIHITANGWYDIFTQLKITAYYEGGEVVNAYVPLKKKEEKKLLIEWKWLGDATSIVSRGIVSDARGNREISSKGVSLDIKQ